jgi:lysozyme
MKTLRARLIRPLALLILPRGLLGLVGLRSGVAHAATVCPSPGSLKGVDVSVYQGSIDWTQVAQAGISFGYARVMDGSFIDTTFQTNFAGMKSAGVKRGAYLFFEPGEDPVAQANAFLSSLSQAGFTSGDLIPAIAVETTGGQSPTMLASKLQTMVQTIQAALGVSPVIYTAANFWNSPVQSTAFSSNPLWIANWGVSCPHIPIGWSTWTVWQYADNGTVPGIIGSVDLNQSNGPTLPIFNAAAQISYLTNLVNSFGLNPGIQKTLDDELNVAAAAVNAGKPEKACAVLYLFIVEVKLLTGHGITSSQASQLLATAKLIRTTLDCSSIM